MGETPGPGEVAAASGGDARRANGDEVRLSFDRYAQLVRDVLDVAAASVAVSGEDGQLAAGASGLPPSWPAQPWAPMVHAVRQLVIETGAPVAVSDARNDDRTSRLAPASGPLPGALLAVPLTGAERVVGALCAIGEEKRDWTDQDLHLLTGLGAACSSELDLRDSRARARAGQREAESARQAAEQDGHHARVAQQRLEQQSEASQRSAQHSRLLLSMSEALTATSTVDSVIRVVQQAAADHLEARSADIEVGPGRAPEQEQEQDSGVRQRRTLTVPLSGQLTGRLTLTWATDEAARPWILGRASAGAGESDEQAQIQETIAALAHYTSTALDRAVLLQERRSAAATLQHAMLTTLPDRSDVDLAARYVPAASANQVGGDWYDAIAVPETVVSESDDDSLAVVIGDVAGHDIEAAATMGQVRSILRGLLVDRPQPPAQMIARLDAALARLGMPTSSSLVLAMLHENPDRPGSRRLSWASAGHPAPLRITSGGRAELLKGSPDLLLGIPLDLPRHTRHADLNPGDTLVLYTDGLIQKPGHRLADGQRRLMDSARENHEQPLAEVLDSILRDLVTDAPADDCAVLAVRLL